MRKILFICHGNICRSVTAEYIMKYLVKDEKENYIIDSAATTTEEIGNDIYPPSAEVLKKHNIPFGQHQARKIDRKDYEYYDEIICMDNSNVNDLFKMFDNDYLNKVSLLLDKNISDPWYTRNFELAFKEIYEGCEKLLNK